MEKKILLILLSACAFCVSCGGEQHPGMEPQSDPVFDVGYRIGTRADGARAPENKDTYTIMSYMVTNPNGTPTATPHVVSSAYQRGYYVYLENGNAAYVEDDFLVPTRIRNEGDLITNYPYTAWDAADPVRENSYGQRLQAGKYKTAVLHPAVPVISSGHQALGLYMAVLPRNISCPVYAPIPGLAGEGLLDMTVEKNMTVYDIDSGHELLYITLAKMRAYFYSSSDVDYTISSMKLLNAGSSGWFNPYTGVTYPNYGSDPRVFSLDDGGIQADPANWKVSGHKGGSFDLGLVTEADNGVGDTYDVHYLMDDEAIFATDYRGQSDGGTLYQYVKTIIMRITVSMPIPGSNPAAYQDITADIPVSLDIERGKLYNFYFDVRSGIFTIRYSVHDGAAAGWEEGNSDTGGLNIGETIDYGTFRFEGSGGWVPENGGDGGMDIGGN